MVCLLILLSIEWLNMVFVVWYITYFLRHGYKFNNPYGSNLKVAIHSFGGYSCAVCHMKITYLPNELSRDLSWMTITIKTCTHRTPKENCFSSAGGGMGTVTRRVAETICYFDKVHKGLTSQMKAVEKYFHEATRPYFYNYFIPTRRTVPSLSPLNM